METGFYITKDVKSRFLQWHQRRKQRTQELMRPKQADFLDILPYLIHVNDSALPGYLGTAAPSGIFSYIPSEAVVSKVHKLWPQSQNSMRRSDRQNSMDIEAVFVMGSCGTVAYSKKSDFDIWVCHTDRLVDTELASLQEKLHKIEEWAELLKLEVHFFLVNPKDMREGRVGNVDAESSGSAQHFMLLDEFYRTSIWLAGKHPLWWYIPPDNDNNYEAYAQSLYDRGILLPQEVLDLGALHHIPKAEYYGAALWQLYKGIESPYKSVLKLTLMECYAVQHDEMKTLSHQLKVLIYENEENLNRLDPYVMLLNFLDDYLETQSEDGRAEFIHRSFYYKVNLPLSQQGRQSNWRVELVHYLTEQWGWNQDKVALLDDRSSWSIKEIMAENALLLQYLSKSYMFLSKYVREHSDKLSIKSEDLQLLGRKLYAVFERKEGKVELINRGVAGAAHEDKMTYFKGLTRDNKDCWLLYTDKVTNADMKNFRPVKVTAGLVELLAWCFFNRLISAQTQTLLHAPGADINNQTITQIYNILKEKFPDKEHMQPENDSLMQPARLVCASVFINVGVMPVNLNEMKAKDLVVGKVDLMKDGVARSSLFQKTEFLYFTSWGEVIVRNYRGVEGLIQWLCDYINICIAHDTHFVKPDVQCMTSRYGQKIAIRVTTVVERFAEYAVTNQKRANCRYVIEGPGVYYFIYAQEGIFRYSVHADLSELLAQLEGSQQRFCQTVLEREALQSTPLPEMFFNNEQGVVQLYSRQAKDYYILYIVDEYGGFFYQRVLAADIDNVLASYKRLLEHYKQTQGATVKGIKFYQLDRQGGQYLLTEQSPPAIAMSLSNFEITVQGVVEDGKKVLFFSMPGKDVSSQSYGNKVFTKVAYSWNKRRDGKSAFPYVSQMDMQASLFGEKSSKQIRLYHWLKYKRSVESKIQRQLLEINKKD